MLCVIKSGRIRGGECGN